MKEVEWNVRSEIIKIYFDGGSAQVRQAQKELELLRQKIEQAARSNNSELETYLHSGIAEAFSEQQDSLAENAEEDSGPADKILEELEAVLDAQTEISDSLFERAVRAKAMLTKWNDEAQRKNFEVCGQHPGLFGGQRKISEIADTG